MSDNSDEHSRDNTSPKYKPKDSVDKGYAPPGQLGTQPGGPTPTGVGGVKVVRMTVDVAVQDNEPEPSPELTPEEQRAEYLNNLPEGTTFTALTGDKAVDEQSVERGEVPVTENELDKLKSQDNENPKANYDRPQMSQSDYARAFRQASERTNEVYKSKGQDIE